MSAETLQKIPTEISIPDIPALCAGARLTYILTTEGELKELPHEQAGMIIRGHSALICHSPYTRSRLGMQEFYAFDVLELFAFVHPARFCVPTIAGLCKALGLAVPGHMEDYPLSLIDITKALLLDLQKDPYGKKADPLKIAGVMGLNGKGWPWTPFVFAAFGQNYELAESINSKAAMNIWKALPEWAEEAPEPPPSHHGVTIDESQERLRKLLGPDAEKRQVQIDYSAQITKVFAPLSDENEPHIVLAEAGTGIGKTLGYLAPASIWAEKNKAAIWISTYTKNLQRQIDGELDRLYPNKDLKETHAAVRKGRENYLCLLNLEETVVGAAMAKNPGHAIAAGIMARWGAATKDGDLSGADFPGWLTGILGYRHTVGMADRRGECLYSACDHYRKCFVERSIRKAKHARIVVANHALVMISSALSSPGEDLPGRYIFDEGHHLFSAADSAFSAHLSARETRDLRRWILGPEGGKRSRTRGLLKRAEDLAASDEEAEKALRNIIFEASCLTAEGWSRRLKDGIPSGPTEQFLAQTYKQVYARANERNGPYSIETHTQPIDEGALEKARTLKKALEKLRNPIQKLANIFRKQLNDDDGNLDSDTRKRMDTIITALEKRSRMTLQVWIDMLVTLENGEKSDKFVDWMKIERIDGKAIDVGLYRHWIDPMKPFAASIKPHLHGMAVTSATLRDGSQEDEENWSKAKMMTGADYLSPEPHMVAFDSPFDYAQQTKIFIINDVRKDDLGQVSGAYRALFEASGGGALGLFTAITRLRAVHGKIISPLEEKEIALYAQHVDEIDAGTLVDIFRDDIHSCLLGTDAIRDGVDVPGESLRLIVFDRVPWPRPTILHKARREAFGGRKYDEMITRLKLKQAFGRLIRRTDDKGVFVMLDNMLPSRLQTAFPEDAEIVKCGLAETVESVQDFLSN